MHDGFDFWIAGVEDADGPTAASLERANEAAQPTARLASVEAAYWTDVGTREHLRWVMPHDEERLLDALARLHAAGGTCVAEGSRLVGMFRAHGLLVPVWDLPWAPAPRCWRSRRPGWLPTWPRRWRTSSPLTARGARGAQRAGAPAAHHPLTCKMTRDQSRRLDPGPGDVRRVPS